MAAIELTELIPHLQVAMSPVGTDRYADVSDVEWLTRLQNAFWTAHIDGLFDPLFRADEDGLVTHPNGSTFTRDLQQMVILYALIGAVQNDLLQLKTLFRAKAGPVEYETQQSAQVLRSVLDSLLSQKDILLERLTSEGSVATFYLDGVRMRDVAMRANLIDWNGF